MDTYQRILALLKKLNEAHPGVTGWGLCSIVLFDDESGEVLNENNKTIERFTNVTELFEKYGVENDKSW